MNDQPVYRGIKVTELHDLDDYEPGSVGTWP